MILGLSIRDRTTSRIAPQQELGTMGVAMHATPHSLKRSYNDMAQISAESAINPIPQGAQVHHYDHKYSTPVNVQHVPSRYYPRQQWMHAPPAEPVAPKPLEAPEKSLVRLSLQLKLRGIILFAASPEADEVAIDQCLDDVTHELLELYYAGVSKDEDKILAFLELVEERLTQCLKKKYNDKNYYYKGPRSFERLAICKSNYVSRKERTNLLKQRWHVSISSRDQTLSDALLTNGPKDASSFADAIQYLRKFDRFSLHFFNKMQHNRLDECLIQQVQGQGNFAEQSWKKAKASHRTGKKAVRFAESAQTIGKANEDVDRTPIRPSKPSVLESLMIRTSRVFPVDSI